MNEHRGLLPLRRTGRRILVTAVMCALAIALTAAGASNASAPASTQPQPVCQSQSSRSLQGPPVEISGTARPGDLVQVFEGETLLGEATADAGGSWRLTVQTLDPKPQSLRVQVTPAAPPEATPAPRGGEGGTDVTPPEAPTQVVISIVVGEARITVSVLVSSPNGEVIVEVSVPIATGDDACVCPDCGSDGSSGGSSGGGTSGGGSSGGDSSGSDSGCAQWYTVQRGDTLSKIGARFGVSALSLAQINGLSNPNVIFIGQKLCVQPGGGGTSSPDQTYTVRPGDTLASIGRQYGWSAAYLAKVNGLSNPDKIYPGQVLTIPSH